MSKGTVLTLVLAASLGGCAIHQNVTPMGHLAEREICVVENPNVKNGFLESYRKTLAQKGYEVRMLPASASLNSCAFVSTYTASWRWDLALYMAYAEIKVYERAAPKGSAVYDATKGGGNLGKFISADQKIAELVNQLFPGGAGP